ncbi:hypothetical protein QYE76_064208 [Lolium multiflorum]|uniref:Uncharacterized protein n=1 Tax=Lolium multiflorum TaxID=4521 RepID=A0AAD8S781_LOLMU|nr:hypothetical protein QYE76_064208 [Lolium multiflorum]
MGSSSTNTLAGLSAALGAPPAQQLTRGNFLLWKALVFPAFRGANVMALLEGTDTAPAKMIEAEDADHKKIQVENPAYVTWLARDQQVLRFLLNTVSPDILSHLLDVSSTADAWSAINAMFKTASRTKAQHLREKLNDTKKLSLTADAYYTKMKSFASELSALGKPVEDDEMLGYLLHGLDKGEYNALITSVNANAGTILDDFFEQLSSYDMRNGVEENSEFISSANLARRGATRKQRPRGRTPPPRGHTPPPRGRSPEHGSYRGGGYRDRDDDRGHWRRDERQGDRRDDRRDRRRDDGGGDRRRFDNGRDGNRNRFDRTPTPYVDTDCQICTKHGHPASKCWWRYSDDKKNRDDGEKGANLASYGVDTNWYTDTGATDHITGELNKLLVANKYHGQDSVNEAACENPAKNGEENAPESDAEVNSETDNSTEHEEDLEEYSSDHAGPETQRSEADPRASSPRPDSPGAPGAVGRTHAGASTASSTPGGAGRSGTASVPASPSSSTASLPSGASSPSLSPSLSPELSGGSSVAESGGGEHDAENSNSENSNDGEVAPPPPSPPRVNHILSQKLWMIQAGIKL